MRSFRPSGTSPRSESEGGIPIPELANENGLKGSFLLGKSGSKI